MLPVTAEPERRAEVFERELWRIAVEHLDYGEQHVWAALAGARVAPNGWRRGKAMLHFDRGGELVNENGRKVVNAGEIDVEGRPPILRTLHESVDGEIS